MPVLEQLKWLPVEKSLYLRDCVMAYKCLNNSLPDYLYQTFITRSEISNCVTRQSSQLHKPLCRTSTAQKSFLYRASTLWNDLHESFKSKFFKTLLCVWISWWNTLPRVWYITLRGKLSFKLDGSYAITFNVLHAIVALTKCLNKCGYKTIQSGK